MKNKKRNTTIPTRVISEESVSGIIVAKETSEGLQSDERAKLPHRHDAHFFVLQEKGVSLTEIDFEDHLIETPTVLYQAPNQVHRALKVENIELLMLIINDENINANYLKLLQSIAPTKPIQLLRSDLEAMENLFLSCLYLYQRKEDKLFSSQLRDGCNALIALTISLYMRQSKATKTSSRFEIIEKSFTELLEQKFVSLKRPSDYANLLNISTSYLNECIKNVTGFSVTHRIKQRNILEAKRLLYHTNKSVKEIASELGYKDYPYFSRLFTKEVGTTAQTFRNKKQG
ncbi:MAG: helix-turn-helix transcriptional regulator [Chitinophagales bacterium]|nr:helix-turn-helix transcriptional regulator [Chitinophagales bacterium]